MFHEAYQFIVEQLQKNDLVAGGAMLGALAYILSYLRSVPFTLMYWSRLAFITEIDIPDKTSAFLWISDWLSEHRYSKKAKRVTVESKKAVAVAYEFGMNGRGSKYLSAQVSPAPGNHFIWWGWSPMIVTRIRREGNPENGNRAYRESWSIRIIGSRKKLESFIEECRSLSERDKDSTISVSDTNHGYWESIGTRRKRPIESVILPLGIQERLINDVKEWFSQEKWYHSMCIPWRRGYLFHGSPGNGKSSLITALASELGFEVCIVNLLGVDENDIKTTMSNLPKMCILVLEDIDCVFTERKSEGGISLSGLLNLLDGVNASEGRIVVMTTNHLEKLDPALIRPGRIDMTIELKNATAYQAGQLYKRFFPDCRNHESFGDRVASMNVSMAKLQGYLLRYKNSMKDARANIKELLDA